MKFYRCALCKEVVNLWDIKESKGCPKCGGHKISLSNLTLWEKVIQIAKHPKIWEWEND